MHDLTNFRAVGQTEFRSRIEYYILRKPSTNPPKRGKCLLTFTERKSHKKKVTDIERERRLQIECWKKRVTFASTTGTSVPKGYQQFIELPRAIATSSGEQMKGTKANSTKVYEKRYASIPVIRSSLPSGWIPSTVIMEACFLLTLPRGMHTNV